MPHADLFLHSPGPLRTLTDPGVVRITLPVPETDPSAFIHAMAGEARGFWGRGDRWVAWGGALADLTLPESPVGNRFEEIRRGIRSVARRHPQFWADLAPADRPRFFGGFSFLDAAPRSGDWHGFPRARFILPRMLLERGDDGVRLIAQGHPGDEPALRARIDRLEERISALRDREVGIPADPRALPNGEAIDPSHWHAAVGRVLAELDSGRVAKVVLARTADVELPAPARTSRVLRFLRHENRMAHVFLLEPEPGRIFLGAAPEVLAELRGGRFEATAVAGSIPRGADDAQDRALAERLLASAKDGAEHRVTAEEMTEILSARLDGMEAEGPPHVLTLARIQHLETRIRGIARPGEDILSIVEALHPTPAVCGRPRNEALSLIGEQERFDRGWYAGPVGWVDAAGEGDFVPALRSAVGSGERWRLFAGAGIVPGSDPESEWAETALKFEPALRALAAGMDE